MLSLRNLIQLQLFGNEVSYCNTLRRRGTDFSIRQTYQWANDGADINLNAFSNTHLFSCYLSVTLFKSNRIKKEQAAFTKKKKIYYDGSHHEGLQYIVVE